MRRLLGYRGWKVWGSYDMHVCLCAALYFLLIAGGDPLRTTLLLTSLGFYFMYGFLINDFFDMPLDVAAGKRRAVHELSRAAFVSLIAAVIVTSGLHLWYLREPLYVAVYTAAYALATLYSAPPARLKERGVAGVVVNGLIEKALPVLAVVAFFHSFGFDAFVLLTAAFLMGVADIVAHQIYDYESDAKTGCGSLVTRIGKERAIALFRGFVAPPTSAALFTLSALVSVRIPAAAIFVVLTALAYLYVFLLVRRGSWELEEEVFPLHLSCAFRIVNNVLPVVLVTVLGFRGASNLILVPLVLFSQYKVVVQRLRMLKARRVMHAEIVEEA
ncbi:MAG TPA: hypothetical protein ENF26_04600 [Methanomicrobia archaeon]|nr:hypothetical protein [Methanomicrobia archaeon]HEX59410.1 hypothetical protein [Methanomicrobia archaeon]